VTRNERPAGLQAAGGGGGICNVGEEQSWRTERADRLASKLYNAEFSQHSVGSNSQTAEYSRSTAAKFLVNAIRCPPNPILYTRVQTGDP
jgi:hypothetical protein